MTSCSSCCAVNTCNKHPIVWIPATLIILVVFFSQSTKIRDSVKSTLCEYVAVVDTFIHNTFLYKTYIQNSIAVFLASNSHSRCLLVLSPRCMLKYKNENFEYFCRQNQNHRKSQNLSKSSQNQHFYMLCTL